MNFQGTKVLTRQERALEHVRQLWAQVKTRHFGARENRLFRTLETIQTLG